MRIIECLGYLTFLVTTGSTTGLASGLTWNQFNAGNSQTNRDAKLPLIWSEEDNLNWRVPIDGFGQSSPIIWQGNVYVTSVDTNADPPLIVTAFNVETGARVWAKRFSASQNIEYTRMIARAAPTAAADSTGLVVFFGSGDLFKLSHDGEMIWSQSITKDYGEFKGNHGIASSPVLFDDHIFLLIAHEGSSYTIAFSSKTGALIWKKDREAKVSWSTPLPLEYQGKKQLILSSNGIVEAIEATTGNQLWFTHVIEKNNVPSPVRYKDTIIVGSSEAHSTAALTLGGSGNRSNEAISWRGAWASSFGSPLIDGDSAYIVNRRGVLARVAAKTGEILWKHRLGDSCWATPFAASSRLYFFTKSGQTVVMAPEADEPSVLAINNLPTEKDDEVYGVAISSQSILVRTGRQLTAIGKR